MATRAGPAGGGRRAAAVGEAPGGSLAGRAARVAIVIGTGQRLGRVARRRRSVPFADHRQLDDATHAGSPGTDHDRGRDGRPFYGQRTGDRRPACHSSRSSCHRTSRRANAAVAGP